jgi:phospholipid/cholesterol/gamma-HCH transport system permease protein
MEFIGVQSLPIILLTSFFTGAVFALQSYRAFALFGAESMVGGTVGVALTRELAPTLTGLLVAGRAGSAMAAEIGSMRVSEQIDALDAMAVDPINYLVKPRLVAAALVTPMLTAIYDFVGIVGSWAVCIHLLAMDEPSFMVRLQSWVDWDDIWGGLLKGWVFGVIIGTVACYKGFYTEGGARGRRAGDHVVRRRGVGVDLGVELLHRVDAAVSAGLIDPVTGEPSAIVYQGVKKRFGTFEVLKGLDLLVPRGKITVIIGRSGTGKSVTMKHVMGLLRPDAGRIWVGDGRRADGHERPQTAPRAEPVRHRVPERGAVRLDERVRQHRVPAARTHEHAAGRHQREDQGVAGSRGAAGRRGEDAGRAVGRHAQTRRARPGARARPRVLAVRRADDRPRPHLVGGDGTS